MALWQYLWAGSTVTKSLYHLNGNSTDSSWNGNNGTDTAITYVNWLTANQCASFNGSTSIIVANVFDCFWTQPLTISAKIKVTTLPTASNITMPLSFIEATIDAATYDKSFDINSSWQLSFRVYDGATKTTSISWISAWNIYHIVWTYDWTNIRVYLNWVSSTPTAVSWTFNFTTPILWFSGNWAGGRVRYNWLIDEVIIDNRAWTAIEVKKQYTYQRWILTN